MKNVRLKAARTAMDMSQGGLADTVGITRQIGKYNPALSVCLVICKALNKTLDELFWDE